MSRRFTVGLDLGGTNIKAGLLDEAGRLVHRKAIPTEGERGYAHVVSRLAAVVGDLLAEAHVNRAEVIGVGLGSPGPMSPEDGIVHGAPNLPGWVNVPVQRDLSSATGLPVMLDNDANLYALGEFTAGAGRASRDMVLLTLGTGIGGGIILNGQLFRGRHGNAGEVGHMLVVPDGRACPCGQRGCLERYASATAVAERFADAVRAGEPSLLAERIHAGVGVSSREIAAAAGTDALAGRIWDEACRFLAVACVNLQHVLNVEQIVLGGGMIGAGELLLRPVREHFERLTWRVAKDAPRIELARLGDDAGIIGAAAAARELEGRSRRPGPGAPSA